MSKRAHPLDPARADQAELDQKRQAARHPTSDAAAARGRSQGRVAPRAEPSTQGAKRNVGGRKRPGA